MATKQERSAIANAENLAKTVKKGREFIEKKVPKLREDVDLTKIAQVLYQRKEKGSSEAEA